jgi:hypothetical protein
MDKSPIKKEVLARLTGKSILCEVCRRKTGALPKSIFSSVEYEKYQAFLCSRCCAFSSEYITDKLNLNRTKSGTYKLLKGGAWIYLSSLRDASIDGGELKKLLAQHIFIAKKEYGKWRLTLLD